MTTWSIVDVVLLLGATLRAARLIITDDIGRWWVRGPAHRWAVRHSTEDDEGWRAKLVSGLDCGFCVGFWIAGLAVASLLAAHHFGDPWHTIWRAAAGVFTLNWVAAHIGIRTGDTGYADPTDDDEVPQ